MQTDAAGGAGPDALVKPPRTKPDPMTNRVSFWMLVATVIAVGLLFFQVMRPFFFPLMSAGILALLFRPVYVWLIPRCRGRYRLAAVLTTLLVVLVGLVPLAAASYFAGRELVSAGNELAQVDFRSHPQVARAMAFLSGTSRPSRSSRCVSPPCRACSARSPECMNGRSRSSGTSSDS